MKHALLEQPLRRRPLPKRRERLRFAIALMCGALLAGCSQTIGVTPPPPAVPSDFFWQAPALASGINYSILRNGSASDHRLTSQDGSHIRDAALGNAVSMVAFVGPDSVLLDSMGTNALFSLPAGYFFGSIATQTHSSVFLRDSIVLDVHMDSVKPDSVVYDTVRDTISRDTVTVVQQDTNTVEGGLLLLYGSHLDSGATWLAGNLLGPGLGSGIPIYATVLDRIDSLLIPPAAAGADSTFGESFRIRYAAPTGALLPVYWIAYYSKDVGPVLVQQYTSDSVMERAQILGPP